MVRSSPTPTAQPRHPLVCSAAEDKGHDEASAVGESLRPSLLQTGFQEAGLVRKDKETVDDIPLERRDTTESFLSDYRYRRSNTGWSIADSTATDLTDLNSPDVAGLADDSTDLEAGGYASSPRRSGFFTRPTALQKRLQFRTSSISCDADKPRAFLYGSSPDTPASRYRRPEKPGPRNSSLNRLSNPSAPSPEPGSADHRGSSPLGTIDRRRVQSSAEPDDGHRPHADVHHPAGIESGHSPAGTPRPSPKQPHESVAGEVWDQGCGVDRHVQANDRSPPPGVNSAEATVASTRSTALRVRSNSTGSGASTICSRVTNQPDDSMVYDICDQVLQHAFGVQLDEVAIVGAVSVVYESVGYCLDELSHIVRDNGLCDTAIAVNETARDGESSNNAPAWHASAAGDAARAGNGSGAGGGGRKRPNGGHEGADPGGGAGDGSPGGKRLRTSSGHPQAPDQLYSCPFRKRNPLRFNVRDHQNCAVQSFPNISQLKRHVKNFHKQKPLPFTCQRCRQPMMTQEALQEHVSVGRDRICNPQRLPASADPEDGITSEIEEALNERKADTKVDGWVTMWRLLFPGDQEIPKHDFVPPTELDEVRAQFSSDHHNNQLRRRIQEALGSAGNVDGMCAMFENHVELVFEACRLKTSGMSGECLQQLRLQSLRQSAANRQNPVLLTPQQPTPNRRGSSFSDRSITSPIANSGGFSALINGLHRPLVPDPQASVPSYAAPSGGYHGTDASNTGESMMMPSVSGNNPSASQCGPPTAIPPAARIHLEIPGSSGETRATPPSGQPAVHLDLLPSGAGLGLGASLDDGHVTRFSALPSFDTPDNSHVSNLGQPIPEIYLPNSGSQREAVHCALKHTLSPVDQDVTPSASIFGLDGGYEMIDQSTGSAWNSGNGW